MLKSLFGDLSAGAPPSFEDTVRQQESSRSFVASAIVQSTATAVNEHGQMFEQHVHDLYISGPAAQAMREHFAQLRDDLDSAPRRITLFDPLRTWGPAVIKTLAQASGQSIERLRLRDQASKRTLAMVERTSVVRRVDETLKVYHAEVRSQQHGSGEIPLVLMERSHMAVLILGVLPAQSLDSMLEAVAIATHLPTWRCPTVLFMVPPSARAMADKIRAVEWPAKLEVQILEELLDTTSAVWNALLGAWNRARTLPQWENAALLSSQGAEFPIRIADFGHAVEGESPPAREATRVVPKSAALDAQRAGAALGAMLQADGLIGCAIARAADAAVLARHLREDHALDIDGVAKACVQILRTLHERAREMSLPDTLDEVTISAGPRLQVLRTLARQPGHFIFAVMDRERSNLGMVRLKMAEVEKALF